MLAPLIFAAALTITPAAMDTAFQGHKGALVVIDCESGSAVRHNPGLCAEKYAPCSTFKIWNTAIGLELGLINGADEPFYKWDGVRRSYEAWNHDLTLRQAFSASCVPAFQALARRIGAERMQDWLKRIPVGNADISSGIDVFWLPEPGRHTLRISPDEQANLLVRLVKNDLPFSGETLAVLKEIMATKTTPTGFLYGKTGSSGQGNEPNLGWFVGFLESGKKTYAFACLLTEPGAAGKDARAVVEQVFADQGLL